MKRLLHVVRSLRRETGGLAEAVRNLSAVQRRRGDHVTLVSFDAADQSEEVITFPGGGAHGYGYVRGWVPWLRQRQQHWDAVVVHGLWQYHSFGTWRALRGSRTPYFVYCHGMLDPWFKRSHPMKHLKKSLYWPWAEYRVLRDAAGVCFTAEAERRRARESFRLYRAREYVAPIGIAAPAGDAVRERAAFLTRFPACANRPFLLFLGRIHPKKGLDLLLRGYAAKVTGTSRAPLLVLAGPCADDDYLAALKRESVQRGIASDVVWCPMLTGDLKWGALRACEAFVLFSHQENFGVAVAEALACGRPVLISDQINISDEIAAAGAGIIVSDTESGAANGLHTWGNLTPARRAAMSEAAVECFARHFHVENAIRALDRVLEKGTL